MIYFINQIITKFAINPKFFPAQVSLEKITHQESN